MEHVDWLSRLLDIIPVAGRAEHRCFFAAPWRLENGSSEPGEIPYHVILAGSAVLEGTDGQPSRTLNAGDILLLTRGPAHVLHDGGGQAASPIRQRIGATITVDENDGQGERLDMLCGRFIFSAAHARLIHDYFPSHLVVNAAEHSAIAARPGARAQLANLVGLMRSESAEENLVAKRCLQPCRPCSSLSRCASRARIGTLLPGCSRWPAIRAWQEPCRPCWLLQVTLGRCRNSPVSAECRGPRSSANSSRASAAQPRNY